MRTTLVSSTLLSTLYLVTFVASYHLPSKIVPSPPSLLSEDIRWSNYVHTLDKKFSNDRKEVVAMQEFIRTQEIVKRHNEAYKKGEVSYRMAINKFSDLTEIERMKWRGLKVTHLYNRTSMNAPKSQQKLRDFIHKVDGTVQKIGKESKCSGEADDCVVLPDSIDWREKGHVTEVKSQGHCGSCWAFAANGAMEAAHKRATGELTNLSEQNLIDCSFDYGNDGCDGGLYDWAFNYVIDNEGIDKEKSYPYESEDGSDGFKCRFKKEEIGTNITEMVYLAEDDEEEMKRVVGKVGPVAVAIQATDNLVMYSEGVFFDKTCEGGFVNHAVLVVGYGTTEKGEDYWLVKNSWGKDWGENGYVRMARNQKNNCAIASMGTIPMEKTETVS